MSDPTNAEKAEAIIAKSADAEGVVDDAAADQAGADATTGDASQEDKQTGSESKQGDDQQAGDEKLYAGIFKDTDTFEKSVNELAGTLNMSTLNKRMLKSAIAEAKESKDFTEVEAIYKELQAEQSKSKQGERADDTRSAEQVKQDEERTRVDPEELEPLTKDERRAYVVGEINRRLQTHPIRKQFEARGIEMPTAQYDTQEWEDAMIELAEQNPALYNHLTRTVEKVAREEVNWLSSYEQAQTEARTSVSSVEKEGKAALEAVNTRLELGLKPEEMTAIIKQAMKDPESYEHKMGLNVLKKNAVIKYFNANVLPDKIGNVRENALKSAALKSTKDRKEMHERALNTAGTSSLSTNVDRRGTDKANFSSHKSVAETTKEQREARINEIIAKTQD